MSGWTSVRIGHRLNADRPDYCGYTNLRGVAPCQLLRRLPAQYMAGCHDDAALEHVCSSRIYARPVVVFQCRHHFIGDRIDRLALLLGELLDEVLC